MIQQGRNAWVKTRQVERKQHPVSCPESNPGPQNLWSETTALQPRRKTNRYMDAIHCHFSCVLFPGTICQQAVDVQWWWEMCWILNARVESYSPASLWALRFQLVMALWYTKRRQQPPTYSVACVLQLCVTDLACQGRTHDTRVNSRRKYSSSFQLHTVLYVTYPDILIKRSWF